jgi:hypothetical protein
LAEHCGLPQGVVLEALATQDHFTVASLEAPVQGAAEETFSLAELLGAEDRSMDLILDCTVLRPLLAGLEERDRKVLELRFYHDLTQAQIGAEIGCSQMHVSRILTRVLAQLRRGMMPDCDAPPAQEEAVPAGAEVRTFPAGPARGSSLRSGQPEALHHRRRRRLSGTRPRLHRRTVGSPAHQDGVNCAGVVRHAVAVKDVPGARRRSAAAGSDRSARPAPGPADLAFEAFGRVVRPELGPQLFREGGEGTCSGAGLSDSRQSAGLWRAGPGWWTELGVLCWA